MKLVPLVTGFSFALTGFAFAETRYGSFLHDERMPESLFLTGEIRQADSFNLRKALREHDIRIVIMGSAGGNLYEGLQMGSILRDKGISTYVPAGVNCESSCANMFFGGANRKAEGQLGVHQFYSSNRDENAPLGVAEASAQYTMADVIGIMNELSTPPFVYEKMLGTTEMHYFSDEEKRRLDLNADDPDFLDLQARNASFIVQNPSVVIRPETTVEEPVTASAIPAPETGTQYPEDPPSTRMVSKRFETTDFFGADLFPKGLRGISLGDCEQACQNDDACAAWSYVHATRWCWPKSGVTNVSFGEGITSGIVDPSKIAAGVLDRPFIEATATDLPGFDILPRGMTNTSLDECRSACEASSTCRAFTWIGKKNICYPKFFKGSPSRFMGAISGWKQ